MLGMGYNINKLHTKIQKDSKNKRFHPNFFKI